YRLDQYRHRYPHCWRCGTPLVFRLVDEWYISMGPLYDQPREQLTREQVDASLRYQIMEVVDRIRWIPGFGHERELDWLRTMQDWMISKKRYWGLALPIYPCEACGTVAVMGGREELRARAVEGWEGLEGHTAHRPHIDEVKIACRVCGAPVSRIADVGNPWLDAGIVPFSTLHYREDPAYWQKWFPADFITESFPGQFRNWFYSLLAMSTVLRREPPFRTILGYATLFGEDGRPMHKSSGNLVEFDEAAERMGVDVMRWMYAKQRPEDNILFGYHTADEARRELLVLWNVFAFFVTYARSAGWDPSDAFAPAISERPVLDRWILSRTAGLAAEVRASLEAFEPRLAAAALARHIDELSTWYLRRSRRRFSRAAEPAEHASAFATLHDALLQLARVLAPVLPFLSEHLHQVLAVGIVDAARDSVHLTRWPDQELAPYRDATLEEGMATLLRAVELGRTLRGQAGIRVRQPLARLWLALPGGALAGSLNGARADELVGLLGDELNVREVELIGDESGLVKRRVKPLLPVIGPRLGHQIPAVMAAARADEVEYLPDGGVRLAGVTLSADEVEILATPLPGTAVAHHQGVVVVIDTTITDELLIEGHARELQRALQDLRRDAGLAIADRIEAWVEADEAILARLDPYLASIAQETNAALVHQGPAPAGAARGRLELEGRPVIVGLRRCDPLD
ncbi:MAG: class I tRNA ligase family protein, partial [Chloroflexi bacterium]|nr:class I tRNA ligase family protein [Chloroflexota bacterium]